MAQGLDEQDPADSRRQLTDSQAADQDGIRQVEQIRQPGADAEGRHPPDGQGGQPGIIMTLTDLDDEPCRDDADKAATDHVDEAQAAKEKVSNEVRKPQGYDQERLYKGQCIERRGDADLIRAKRNALGDVQDDDVQCHDHSSDGHAFRVR